MRQKRQRGTKGDGEPDVRAIFSCGVHTYRRPGQTRALGGSAYDLDPDRAGKAGKQSHDVF